MSDVKAVAMSGREFQDYLSSQCRESTVERENDRLRRLLKQAEVQYDALWHAALSLGAMAGRAYNMAEQMPDGRGAKWVDDYNIARDRFSALPARLPLSREADSASGGQT